MKTNCIKCKMPRVRFEGLLAILVASLLAGCSSAVGPEDDEPIEVTYREVQINPWRIEVVGDCDGNVLGIPNQGEFAYEMGTSYMKDDSTWSDAAVFATTRLFTNPDGELIKRNDGENIQMENGDSDKLTLDEGRKYRVHFNAIEWDGDESDIRMPGIESHLEGVADEDGGPIDIVVGNDPDCRVKLVGNLLHGPGDEPEVPLR